MITFAEIARRITASKGGQTIILFATERKAFCRENMKKVRSAKMKRFIDFPHFESGIFGLSCFCCFSTVFRLFFNCFCFT